MNKVAPSLLLGLSMIAATPVVAHAQCVLGGVNTERRFTIHPGETCVINRSPTPNQVYRGLKITVRPKLGRFGIAGLDSLAYTAGNRTGSDYFEYVSSWDRNGARIDTTVRNFVTVAP